MEHFLLAVTGSSFEGLSDEIIRARLPRNASFTLHLPFKGEESSDILVTLAMQPHRVDVEIQSNGDVEVSVELKIYLQRLDHKLNLNAIFRAGQLIPSTKVLMPVVAVPMPVAEVFDPPVLLGVPSINVDIMSFSQKYTDPLTLCLTALIGPGGVIITPNFGGIAQVLARQVTAAITDAIRGVFGHTMLADLLAKVASFLDILLEHILEVVKLPEELLTTLADEFAAALRGVLLDYFKPQEVDLVTIDRTVTIAPSKATPGGGQTPPVVLLIAQLAPRINVVPQGHDFQTEFLIGLSLAST